MLEHVAADVGHDALAEPVHAIEARGARDREDRAHAHERQEIFVHQVRIDPREAEIDHAAHGERHGERGGRGDQQRQKRRCEHALVPQEIRLEREQRAKRGARFFARGGGGRRSQVLAIPTVRLRIYQLHNRGPA